MKTQKTNWKMKLLLGAITLNVANASAAIWGVTELLEAQKASADHFKATLGDALFQQITGLTVDLNAQKVAAKAQIRYVDGGTAKIVSYFCHEHGSEIDCH